MKKILFIMRDFRIGGGEKMTLSLVARLDRSLYQPSIVAVNARGPLRDLVADDVKVTSLDGNQGGPFGFPCRVLLYASRLRKIIQREKPSLVVTDNWFAGMIGCFAVGEIHRCSGKLVVEFHLPVREFLGTSSFYNFLSPFKRLVTALMLRRADRIVAVSKYIHAQISYRLHICIDKIVTIYNGLDAEEIRSKALGGSLSLELHPYIISVGRLSAEKGHEILIRAYRKIADKIDHKLLIIGDGEKRQDLEKLVAKLGLEERVVMPGAISPPPYLEMRAASFLVLPSIWEAFPFVLLEALSLEVPIIATGCDGPIEILQDGKYGMIVPPSDINALSEAMIRFATDPILTNTFRARSLQRAQEFTVTRMMQRYEALFENLCP